MQTLKIECSLNEQELDDIAKGLGWQATITSINEDGAWVNEPNTQSYADYIIKYFTGQIADRVKNIFVEAHKQELLNGVNTEINQYATVIEENVKSKLVATIE